MKIRQVVRSGRRRIEIPCLESLLVQTNILGNIVGWTWVGFCIFGSGHKFYAGGGIGGSLRVGCSGVLYIFSSGAEV